METLTHCSNRLAALACGTLLAAALWTVDAPAVRAEAPKNPKAVIELFTSQGCYSCPPADAYLRELAKRDDVLALSMHVDYWNNLGWTDPYSRPEITQRQRAYVGMLGTSYVYTPQAVVSGHLQGVGSQRGTVGALIDRAKADAGGGPEVALTPAGSNTLKASIGAAPSRGNATVWLVAFDDEHTTQISAGENGGKTLAYANVVRDLRAVGRWNGDKTELTLDVADHVAEGYGNWAILVQVRGAGPIVGAAALPRTALAR